MGNLHCIPSSCAQVVWRSYLPPSIRWRYPGEEWQILPYANNYTLEEDCPISRFSVEFWYDYTDIGISESNKYYKVPGSIYGKLLDVYGFPFNGVYFTHVVVKYLDGNTLQEKIRRVLINTSQTSVYKVIDYNIIKPPELECDCTFKVYRDNEVLHQETRQVCPEVEQLPCRLSEEVKVIKIEKTPYLERIEVVPYAYQNFGGGVYQATIPNECLNIYNNLTTTIIPQFESFPTPTNATEASYGFIKQICSASGCPPPEYEVICNCNEECPPGTCAEICGASLCCYDPNTGESVKEIPLSEFFPDNITDPGG